MAEPISLRETLSEACKALSEASEQINGAEGKKRAEAALTCERARYVAGFASALCLRAAVGVR